MHEPEQRHRRNSRPRGWRASPPAARAAPPASSRPFPQPDPSPQSPSSVTSLCRVLACTVADPPFVPGRLSDRNGSLKILAAPASMRNAEWPCHVSFIGIVSSVICLFAENVAGLESPFDIERQGLWLVSESDEDLTKPLASSRSRVVYTARRFRFRSAEAIRPG